MAEKSSGLGGDLEHTLPRPIARNRIEEALTESVVAGAREQLMFGADVSVPERAGLPCGDTQHYVDAHAALRLGRLA